jgi:putative redox protein
MGVRIEVETQNIDGKVTALGSAEPFTLVVDRPEEGGGGGLGFNGGQLLYLAVAGCISNDLFRDASAEGIELRSVRVKVGGDFVGVGLGLPRLHGQFAFRPQHLLSV